MATFEKIKISWRGRDYVVPANRVLGAIAVIEEHVTLPELQRHFAGRGLPMAKLTMAYAAVLEYAGAQGVSADDIYAEWFAGGAGSQKMASAVMGIMAMMVPPEHLRAGGPAEVPPVGKKKASSSKRPTAR